MKTKKITLLLIAVSLFFASFIKAEEMKMDYIMVKPSDLKWTDAPSVAPGAKIATKNQ